MEVENFFDEIAYTNCKIELKDGNKTRVLEGKFVTIPDGKTLYLGNDDRTLLMDWDKVKITKREEEKETIYVIDLQGNKYTYEFSEYN